MVFLHLCSPLKSPQISLHFFSSFPWAPHSSCFLCSASAHSHSLTSQSYCVIFSSVIAKQSHYDAQQSQDTIPLIFSSSVMLCQSRQTEVVGTGSALAVLLCGGAGKVHCSDGNASDACGKVLCYYVLQSVCVHHPRAAVDHHSTTEAQISCCFCHTANVSSEAEPWCYFYCALRGYRLC